MYIKEFEDIAEYIAEKVRSRDLVITLGARSITTLGPRILNKLRIANK